MLIPSTFEKSGRNIKPIDLPTRLLQDRIIYLSGEITEQTAYIVNMQLLCLDVQSDKHITLMIDSVGGSCLAGFSIKDTIDKLKCKVDTVGTGICASMGAYLLGSGTGIRKATKRCRIMLHSVSSHQYGSYHDLKINFEETKHIQDMVLDDIFKFCKNKVSKSELEKIMERDYYMSASGAVNIGLIDQVS